MERRRRNKMKFRRTRLCEKFRDLIGNHTNRTIEVYAKKVIGVITSYMSTTIA